MIVEKANEWYKKTHQENNPWESAKFKSVYNMTNDARGQFGELIISEAFHQLKANIQEDISNNNTREKEQHYDLKVNNHRIEVKTSCLSSNSWQHEPLYCQSVCDDVIFIDFHYNWFYITVVTNDSLPLGGKSNVEMFGRKHGTLRRNKDDGFKLDFSAATISTLTKAKHCKKFNESATIEDIAAWIGEFI